MVQSFLGSLIDIIYPRACVVCKNKLKGTAASIDNIVCPACWSKIQKNLPPFCHRCGRSLRSSRGIKNICVSCLKRPLDFDRAFSPCVYEGVTKSLIHEFKYKSKEHIGAVLSRLMIDFIREYDLPMPFIDMVIPMPLSRDRLREREFNQAELLGSRIASEFNKEIGRGVLLRHRRTKSQADLTERERLENVRGCFSLGKGADVKGKHILLIDDVLTTGATSSEAAVTLKNSGANIVFVLTLAN